MKSSTTKVYPNIFSGPASTLFDKIIRGEIELGMFFHTPEIPEKLEVFKTLNVRFHLVIKKDLRRNKDVLRSFIGSREIDDTSTRKLPTLERLKKDYPEASIKISSNNLTAHREMVLRGLGVSILPEFLVKQDIKDGGLAELYPDENFNFQMKFIKRKTAVMSTNAKAWIHLCDKI